MAGLANYRNAQNAFGNSAKKRVSGRWLGPLAAMPARARGDQNSILAHGAKRLPGPGFAALQQNGACQNDPPARWLQSLIARFIPYVLYKT